MMRSRLLPPTMLTLLFLLCCAAPFGDNLLTPSSSQQAPSVVRSSMSGEDDDKSIELISEAKVDADTLSYLSYEISRHSKSVELPHANPTEVSYAVLKKGGKRIAKFDGVYHGAGNATDFGLFALLGGETKQMFVSQTVPRGGRHWIVELSPDYRIIYDSAEWNVGREDFMVSDIDGDGVYQIVQELTAFYGFRKLAIADTPLPSVIFRFDQKTRRYLPANHLFRDHALRKAAATIKSIGSISPESRLSRVLGVVLNHILVGEEREAWEFYERNYDLPDRDAIKAGVVALLDKEPVYKFLKRHAR